MKGIVKISLGLVLLVFSFFYMGSIAMAAEAEDEEAQVIFSGAATAKGKSTELTHAFTAHVGGQYDAAKINVDSYFEAEYKGAEDGVFIALSSASGATQWATVYAAKCEPGEEEGTFISTFLYEDVAKAFGENFARLDTIYVYTNVTDSITLNKLAYFTGEGEPVDTSDGSWDNEKEGIAFIGDSIVQNPIYFYGDWNEILGRTDCVNYGIGGQTTKEVEARIGEVSNGNYDKTVILCGINDLGRGSMLYVTIANYRSMFEKLHNGNPSMEIIVLSVLPTTDAFFRDNQSSISYMNAALANMIKEFDYVTFVDCYSSFITDSGYANADYLSDGLHPNEKGYAVIAEILAPYLDDAVEVLADESAVEDAMEAIEPLVKSAPGSIVPIVISICMILVGAVVVLGNYHIKRKREKK